MGFRPRLKTFKLVFTEDELHGLEVTCRAPSTGMYLDLVPAIAAFESGGMTMQQAADLVESLGEHLVSWNLEDQAGQPVPADLAGIRAQELDLTVQIMKSWFEGMTSVPDPLDERSTSGETMVDVPLQMETL